MHRIFPDAPAVIVVHGLWTGRWAMSLLGRRLTERGLRVYSFGYPSVGGSLAGNAEALARFAVDIEAPQVHWLGHSLGGLVISEALSSGAVTSNGRIVMLASPLRGSYAAGRLGRVVAGRILLGHCIGDWLERPLEKWPLANDLGIIAGTGGVGMGRLVAPELPRPHDGAVSVEETRLPGAREHLVLPMSHSGMLVSARVARYAANFLLTGTFNPGRNSHE